MRLRRFVVAVLLCAPIALRAQSPDSGTRLKDVAALQGAASTPVVGYGLVVGLNKTGDKRQTVFSTQTLTNMLEQFGVSTPAGGVKVENVAAVMVTADLAPFAHSGSRMDVTAASLGDARSLQGGVLLPTAMRAPNGQIVAMAQGPLSIGGFAGGNGGNGVQVNHLTVGRVPNGALVSAEVAATIAPSDAITLSLKEPDFTSASQIAQAVNRELGDGMARAVDPATVAVRVPASYRTTIPELVARLEPLPVGVDAAARVVINERTGTVVIGGGARLGPAAVAHGNLSVKIATRFEVSQPMPYSRNGDTAIVPQQDVNVDEGNNKLVTLEPGTTLDAVVHSLNTLGVSPRDIIAIVQALKAAGALHAELVII